MHYPEPHLNPDDLLQALAQTADPQARRQKHLDACPDCRAALERLEKGYARFAQKARDLAPLPAKPFRLPEQPSPARWRLKPLIATGLVAVLLLLLGLAVWPPHFFSPGQHRSQVAAVDLEADRQLMEDVNALVDNALPPAYQQLVAASDFKMDEDLINWIVPSIEDDEDSLI
jgi:anti-sigma factor RsiW